MEVTPHRGRNPFQLGQAIASGRGEICSNPNPKPKGRAIGKSYRQGHDDRYPAPSPILEIDRLSTDKPHSLFIDLQSRL